jgi:hypothetical protein
MQAPTMAPGELGVQPWNQRVSPRGVKWRKELIVMLELEPDPMSMPDISRACTSGRRTVARRRVGPMERLQCSTRILSVTCHAFSWRGDIR